MACKYIYNNIEYKDKESFIKEVLKPDFINQPKTLRIQEIQQPDFLKNIRKDSKYLSSLGLTKEQQGFLNLLFGKKEQWSNFFIQSLVQNATKKGYEKVLFPTGNTASKVEGHTTLEEFKKQKENRIEQLESNLKETLPDGKTLRFTKNRDLFENEIIQLKQELERVETEGFGALKPIYNFYENRVTNILNKLYDVKQITDEYGNTWNEISLKKLKNSDILLQLNSDKAEADANSSLNKKLKSFISLAGIDIEVVDEIKTRIGTSANAQLDFFHKTLKLAEGKIKEDTLPEESGHVYMKMLKQNNPFLYNRMISQVQKYPEIWNKVLEDYSKVYNYDEALLKEEAAGKIIAEYILGNVKKPSLDLKTWWKKVIESLKSIFNLEQFEDMFQIAATNIVNNNVNYTLTTEESKMFQLSDRWNTIKARLLDQHNKLSKKMVQVDGAARERYFYEGEEVKHRGTELIKDQYDYVERTPKQKESDSKKATFGTTSHDSLQNAVNRYLEKKAGVEESKRTKVDTTLDSVTYGKLDNYINTLLNQFPNSEVFTELQVYDKSKDLASTIDLLILDENGIAHIFDYKFITANVTDGYKGEMYISPQKRKVWNDQLNIYKNILKDNYGIEKFGKQRMLPFEVQYDKDSNPVKIFFDGVTLYEQAIPAKEERTGNKNTDRVINSLYDEYKALNENKNIPFEDKNFKLAAIENAINEIKIYNSVEKLIRVGNAELKSIQERIATSDKMDNSILKDMLHKLDVYSSIQDLKFDKSLKKLDGLPELNKNLDDIHELLYGYKNEEGKDIKGKLQIWQEEENLSYSSYKKISSIGSLFTDVSQINNPVVQKLRQYIITALNKKHAKVEKDIYEKLKDLKSKITSFDRILHKKDGKPTGSLIRKYKSEFYDSLEGATAKWVEENTVLKKTVTINGKTLTTKEYFEANLKKRSAYYKQVDPDSADSKIETYNRKYNFFNPKYKAQAYANYAKSRKGNMFIEPGSKWQNAEYAYIVNNPNEPISQFYDLIQKIIKDANELSDDRIPHHLIPSIEKSIGRTIADGGYQGFKNTVGSNLTMRDYELADKDNPSLKLKYLYDLGADKSLDLGEVFLKFAETVYDVKYMSEAEDAIYLLRKTLQSGEIIEVDAVGSPIIGEDGNIKTIPATTEKESIRAFDKLIRYNFYGYTDETDASIGGKSAVKAGDQAIAYMSGVKMFANTFSGIANYVGGNANLWIKAVGGRIFNVKDLATAEKNLYSGDKKTRALGSYFDIVSHDDINRKSRTLKLDTLDRLGKSEFTYFMQQGGDWLVQQTTLQAVLHSHTIKDGKLLKKTKEDKSIYDMTSIVNGEIKLPDGITDDIYNKIRRRTQGVNKTIMGAMSEQHKYAIKSSFFGRALMHFKTWALPMGKDRFGGITYNADTEMYEEGRFNQFFKILFSKKMIPAITNLATFNLEAFKTSVDEALRSRYDTHIQLNPNFKYNEETGEGLSYEDYKAMFKANIKSTITEVAIASGLFASFLASKPDDDDRGSSAQNYMSKILYRSSNELLYWMDIDSYLAMGGMQLPLVGLLKDVVAVFKGFGVEAYALSSGDKKLSKKNRLASKVAQITPVWNTVDNVLQEIK